MVDKDAWETPQWLFEKLNTEFKFDIDLCASEANAKCDMFCTEYLDRWIHIGHVYGKPPLPPPPVDCAFMNPPYSNPAPFIKKAWEDSKCFKIVCLVKCDTSTGWWGTFWDYENHKPKPGCEVRFFPKRIKFVAPVGWKGKTTGLSFPSALIIMDRRGL